MSRLIVLAVTALVALLASGCVSHVRVGTRPDIDALEKVLRLGESTQTDLLKVLGEPFGRGRSWLPIDTAGRGGPMWTYYYEDTDLDKRDSRALLLFVYFDQDRYVGYMWFSSLPK